MSKNFFDRSSHLDDRTEKEVTETIEVIIKVAEEIDKEMTKRVVGGGARLPFISRVDDDRIVEMLNKVYTKYYEPIFRP